TVAQHLAQHPTVARVHHPGLAGNPWHERAGHYLPDGIPSVFSFDLAGEESEATTRVSRLIDELSIFRLVANLGDARSLIAHPASMTHSHLTAAQRDAAGISLNTVRLSVGIEDPAD